MPRVFDERATGPKVLTANGWRSFSSQHERALVWFLATQNSRWRVVRVCYDEV